MEFPVELERNIRRKSDGIPGGTLKNSMRSLKKFLEPLKELLEQLRRISGGTLNKFLENILRNHNKIPLELWRKFPGITG